MKFLNSITAFSILFAIGATIPTSSFAKFGHNHQASCCVCPHCHHTCKFEAKEVEEEKTCFDVEAKVVCIPRIVFPWQKTACNPCASNGARLRTVCVLTTEKYKCPKCEYSWTPEKTCVTCDSDSSDALTPKENVDPSPAAEPVSVPEDLPAPDAEEIPPAPQPLVYGQVDPVREAPVNVDFSVLFGE